MRVRKPTREQRSEWDLCLEFGDDGERLTYGMFAWRLRNPEQRIYVEVKSKRFADASFYVEHTDARDGRPTGIRATTSDLWWVFVEPVGILIVIPTPLLRAAFLADVGEARSHLTGPTPTHGRLIGLDDLIRWGVGVR